MQIQDSQWLLVFFLTASVLYAITCKKACSHTDLVSCRKSVYPNTKIPSYSENSFLNMCIIAILKCSTNSWLKSTDVF